jgi:hypothetical protein
MWPAIKANNISSKIPLAEAITCMGFFLISFLEELIHYFIHRSDKRSKKSKRQLSQKDEFEIYDKNQRKEKMTKTYSIEDSEVGMLVYTVKLGNKELFGHRKIVP